MTLNQWHSRLIVVKVSCSESDNVGYIPDECCNALPLLGHLCGTEPTSALTQAYCCALYNLFFLEFCQWLSCADRVVNPYMTSDFHCFGELELWPRPALAIMCWPSTWAEIIAIVEHQSWLTSRSAASPAFIPDYLKCRETKASYKTFLRLMPLTAYQCTHGKWPCRG